MYLYGAGTVTLVAVVFVLLSVFFAVSTALRIVKICELPVFFALRVSLSPSAVRYRLLLFFRRIVYPSVTFSMIHGSSWLAVIQIARIQNQFQCSDNQSSIGFAKVFQGQSAGLIFRDRSVKQSRARWIPALLYIADNSRASFRVLSSYCVITKTVLLCGRKWRENHMRTEGSVCL